MITNRTNRDIVLVCDASGVRDASTQRHYPYLVHTNTFPLTQTSEEIRLCNINSHIYVKSLVFQCIMYNPAYYNYYRWRLHGYDDGQEISLGEPTIPGIGPDEVSSATLYFNPKKVLDKGTPLVMYTNGDTTDAGLCTIHMVYCEIED